MPTGKLRPLTISRWVCDWLVRAPMPPQLIRSARYWGFKGLKVSVPTASPMPVISHNSPRAMPSPLDIRLEPSRSGSEIIPFQPTVVRGFSK